MRLAVRDNYDFRATFHRNTETVDGPRAVLYYANWPCARDYISVENQFRDAFEGATYYLVGPIYNEKRFRVGDLLVSLKHSNGRQDVLAGKPWYVVGQRDEAGSAERSVQVIFLRRVE